jgi:hypothetical protein
VWPIYRTGKKLGRTIYRQIDSKPSDDDVYVGMVETPEQAQAVVTLLNAQSERNGECRLHGVHANNREEGLVCPACGLP